MLLAVLEGLDRCQMTTTAQQEYDKTLTYFRNQVHRMDYPTYLSKGWQIGTGAVESACKTVVNQRLNMGGMRWGEAGFKTPSVIFAMLFSVAMRTNGMRFGITCLRQRKRKSPLSGESTDECDAHPLGHR